jgi:1-acyl-sn-glycerol-3-phosphate acyltransferase
LTTHPLVYGKALYRLPLLALSALVFFLYVRVTGDRRAVRVWAKLASRICRRDLVVSGAPPDPSARLVIANHVSHIDPVPIFFLWPDIHPVAMREILSWPVIGRLVRGSAIFVDEEDAGSRELARREMRRAWRGGRRLLVFPEGVIARRRQRFRVGCFEEAIEAGVSIQGVRLTYPPELVATLGGRLFEERFFWVLCQSFTIRVEVFPAEPARGEPSALAATWQERLLGPESLTLSAAGAHAELSSHG